MRAFRGTVTESPIEVSVTDCVIERISDKSSSLEEIEINDYSEDHFFTNDPEWTLEELPDIND